MIYRRTRRFMKSFVQLPAHIQEKAINAFELFRENRRHPSLVVKKMEGKDDIWEGRVDDKYRFVFRYDYDPIRETPVCVFLNIGPHDILNEQY